MAKVKYLKKFKKYNMRVENGTIYLICKEDDVLERDVELKDNKLIKDTLKVGKTINDTINLFYKEEINKIKEKFTLLDIDKKDIDNMFFNEKTAGQYIPKSNSIELSKKAYAFTIDHELLHASTTFVDEATNTIFCGFQQITNKTNCCRKTCTVPRCGPAGRLWRIAKTTRSFFVGTSEPASSFRYFLRWSRGSAIFGTIFAIITWHQRA